MDQTTDAQAAWNARYQSGDTPWEKGYSHPELARLLQKYPPAGTVVVPGCGSGNDCREIARVAPKVIGLDIATEALRLAEAHPKTGQEIYRLADFFQLPDDLRGAADYLFEHTCFCAIPLECRASYVASVTSAVKPGGIFAAIFYKNPDMEPGETGPPFGVSDRELAERFEPAFELLEKWIPAHTFPGREGREECRIYRRLT